MENSGSSFSHQKLFVCLYSDPNFFALSILENLLSKNCLVNIITEDINGWKKLTINLNRTKFGVTQLGNNFVKQKYKYAIYLGGFLKTEKTYDGYKNFLEDGSIQNIKSAAIFPFEKFDFDVSKSLPINDNLSIVYIGDLFGPRMDLGSDLFVSATFRQMLFERKLIAGIGESFYPIFASDAAKTISNWLFSFGPYGKEIFLLGPRISATDFWAENKKMVTDLELKYEEDIPVRQIPRGYEIRFMECNIPFALSETYKWITQSWKKEKVARKSPRIKFRKIRKPKPLPKPIKRAGMVLALILLMPFFTTIVSVTTLYISYKQFIGGSKVNLENRMLLTKTVFVIGKEESRVLANVPILGRLYKETEFISWIGENVSDMAVETDPLIENSRTLFEKVLGDEVYDPVGPSSEIKNTLASFYTKISLIQIETKSTSEKGIMAAKILSSKINFERLKAITSNGEVLADNLPKILGSDQKKSYLILFQNNMELRPTGGFIGSFGVTNFDSGRMNELIVNDVYSADGQLKGHIEPPGPIKNYLGEANWFLRDSNWDPDFPTSAQRAEWFLDKETDQKVDGVVSVDLELVREILRYTGPIFLPDFNLEITDANLYEKTQAEVQDDFFPGTHKKASFLTALSRNLLNEIGKLNDQQKVHVLKTIFDNLEGRHVQLYLHDVNSENAISEIGWGGEVRTPSCGTFCSPDFVGLAEANLGVNKANYFIKRNVSLDVKLTPQYSIKKLTLNLSNSANPALGLTGKYKAYIRILVPDSSTLIGVRNVVGTEAQGLSSETVEIKDRKEIGVITEVFGGQKQKIEFSWQTPIENPSAFTTYGFYIRKQAGVSDDPWTLNVISAIGKLDSNPGFSLTRDSVYTYNMILRKDAVVLFKWKNE